MFNPHECMYIHTESNLKFHTLKLIEPVTDSECDITLVVCYLPNCRETPMLIIDYYFGEPDDAASIKRVVDTFCNSKTPEELQNLVEVQDIAD